MPGRISLDNEFAMASALGGATGLRRSHLRGELSAFTAVHADLEDAADQGLFSHLDPTSWARTTRRWHAQSKAWRQNADRVIVVGEPSAVRAASMLAQLRATKNIAFIDSLDANRIARAFRNAKRPHLVVLEGPMWVRRLTEALQPKAKGTTVFYNTNGAIPDPWGGGAELLAVAGASDPRFGALSPVSLALCHFAKVPLNPIVKAMEVMEHRVRQAGLHDNPAYQLASWVVTALDQLGMQNVTFLLPSPRLAHWGAWARDAWASTTAKSETQTGICQHHGLMPRVVVAGDETAIQRMVEGPSNLLTIAFWAESPGKDLALAEGTTAWSLNKELVGTHIQQLVRSGRPVIRVRLPELTSPVVAGLSSLFLQTALAIAARLEIDPLAMPAAEAWRQLLAGPPSE